MNYIFLDVDGVLNGCSHLRSFAYSIAWYTGNGTMKKICDRFFRYDGIHTLRVLNLAKIVKKTKGRVILTSDDRNELWNNLPEEFNLKQKKLMDLFDKFHIQVFGITPEKPASKDKQILEWANANMSQHDKFIIIDDESYQLKQFVNKELVKTSSYKDNEVSRIGQIEYKGLNHKYVKEAIKKLTD